MGTVIQERIEEGQSRIEKLEEIFSNLSTAFASAKTVEKLPLKLVRLPKLLRARVQLLVKRILR